MKINCIFTSLWDCGSFFESDAVYDNETKTVEIEYVYDVEGHDLGVCVRECITLPDGTDIERYNPDGSENFEVE